MSKNLSLALGIVLALILYDKLIKSRVSPTTPVTQPQAIPQELSFDQQVEALVAGDSI